MTITWYVDDGYAGTNARPQKCKVDDSDIAECETEQEFKDLVNDAIRECFESKISYYFTMPEFKKQEQDEE